MNTNLFKDGTELLGLRYKTRIFYCLECHFRGSFILKRISWLNRLIQNSIWFISMVSIYWFFDEKPKSSITQQQWYLCFHSVHLKVYENLEIIICKLKYENYRWLVCSDLKVLFMLLGQQAGFIKVLCFLWLRDIRDGRNH